MDNKPLIKIEIEGVKKAMHMAFTEELLELDTMFKEAVEAACDPRHVEEILYKEARRCLDEAMRVEVENYFKYGDGREIVKAKVIERLEKVDYE